MRRNLGDVCPITPALFAYLYAAAPHEMGQRLACIVFGKTSGRLPPGLNAIWRSEPATLDLVMGVVHKRLVFLTDAIDVRQAGWEDASRLARALSVGQALSSCSHGLSPNGPSPEIVGMPPAVWLDAGRLAHVLRHLVPDEMDVDDKPGCAADLVRSLTGADCSSLSRTPRAWPSPPSSSAVWRTTRRGSEAR